MVSPKCVFSSYAISYTEGSVLKIEQNTWNSVLKTLSRFVHPESDRIGLAHLKKLAVFRWDIYSTYRRCSNCLRCYHVIWRKKIKNRFTTVHRRFVWNRGLFLDWIAPETDFEKTVFQQFSNLIRCTNGKRRWMPLLKWLGGTQEKQARFARFPGQTRLTRCWNLHFQASKPLHRKRWPNAINSFVIISCRQQINTNTMYIYILSCVSSVALSSI